MLTREVKLTRRPQTSNAQLISISVRLTYRTAVCGPACTPVWQGSAGDRRPYADWYGFLATTVTNDCSTRPPHLDLRVTPPDPAEFVRPEYSHPHQAIAVTSASFQLRSPTTVPSVRG